MKSTIALIGSLLTLIGTVSGGIFFLDTRYAAASTVKSLEKRVDLSELQNLKQEALKHKYFYKDQLRKYPNDKDLKKQLDEASEEVETLKEQIKALKTK